MSSLQIVGRRSSHFTRIARIFAEELGVSYDIVPIYDMTAQDPAIYADNPALKLPILRTEGGVVFGTENICRALADHAHKSTNIVWPEQLRRRCSRNTQELVWHCMTAQVQIVFGTLVAKLPADNLYFDKARTGLRRRAHLARCSPAPGARCATSVATVELVRGVAVLHDRAPALSQDVTDRALREHRGLSRNVRGASVGATHVSIRRGAGQLTSAS